MSGLLPPSIRKSSFFVKKTLKGTGGFFGPKAGRFCSRDPIGYAGGNHLFAYCFCSPLVRTDPTGNFSPIIHHANCEMDFPLPPIHPIVKNPINMKLRELREKLFAKCYCHCIYAVNREECSETCKGCYQMLLNALLTKKPVHPEWHELSRDSQHVVSWRFCWYYRQCKQIGGAVSVPGRY
ncbi:RHS repeat-associated core domain-containing protein [Crateriforma conspicua]|uniref:RHS repeat-associated core domain-containing protein n=1 Tax=Crateriforma conspicua TaxID=2527996 RepID=UPI0011B7EB15